MKREVDWENTFPLFKQLVDEGLTGAAIAARLGITKNAVAGKALRNSMSIGGDTYQQRGEAYQKRAETIIALRQEGKKVTEVSEIVGVHPATVSRLCRDFTPINRDTTEAMLALRTDQCRWPFGDTDKAGFHFCGGTKTWAARGRKLVQLSYCAEHAAIAYEPPKFTRI